MWFYIHPEVEETFLHIFREPASLRVSAKGLMPKGIRYMLANPGPMPGPFISTPAKLRRKT